MSTLIEMPESVRSWLDARRIPLGAPAEDAYLKPYAEWDPERGSLVLARWESFRCPRCGRTDRPATSIVPPPGFDSNNWAHGCGAWWEPFTIAVPLRALLTAGNLPGADPDETAAAITAKLDAHLQALGEIVRTLWGQHAQRTRARLLDELRTHLTLPNDEQEETGSDTEPGLYRDDDGTWAAWDHHPGYPLEDEPIIVHERDLPPSG